MYFVSYAGYKTTPEEVGQGSCVFTDYKHAVVTKFFVEKSKALQLVAEIINGFDYLFLAEEDDERYSLFKEQIWKIPFN